MFVLWQMTIFGSDDGSSELVYVVARNCRDAPPPFLISHVEKVLQIIEDVVSQGQPTEKKMLLEFIPIQVLCGR